MAKNNELAWHEVASVQCVEAPCCGFTFAACHTDEDGSFSCPICDDVPAAEAHGRAEERARIVAWLDDAHRAHHYRGDRLDLGMVAHDIESGAHTEAEHE